MLNICVMFMITTIPGVGLLSEECRAPNDNIWGVEYYEPQHVILLEDLEEAMYFSKAFYYAPDLYYARNSVYPTRYNSWKHKRRVRPAVSVRTPKARPYIEKRKKRLRRKNKRLRKRNRRLHRENRRRLWVNAFTRSTTGRNIFRRQSEKKPTSRTVNRGQRQNRRAERNRSGRRSSRQ